MNCDCCGVPKPQCYYKRPDPPPGTYRARLAAYVRAQEAAPQPESEAERQWTRVGVPPGVRAALRTPQATPALAAAHEFRAGPLTWLLLIGSPGLGKSVAAGFLVAAACREWRWNEQPTGAVAEPARFIEARSLTGVSAHEFADRDMLRQLERVPLLVVDDMGDEGTTVGRDLLVNLLMGRDTARRCTVLTSNLKAAAFKARYGDALASRIRGAGVVPKLSGPDLRESLRARAEVA